MINREEIKKAIDRLGIAGKEVCIHSSMKSFGDEIEGGIDSIIHAFLERDCTIMAPAFSYDYAQRPVKEYMPERNGINDKEALEMPCNKELIYSTDSKSMTDEHMGALPRHILEFPESARGNHPVNSFTAVGRKAEELLAGRKPFVRWVNDSTGHAFEEPQIPHSDNPDCERCRDAILGGPFFCF